MILCLGTTPAAQRVMMFQKLRLDHVNRAAVTRDGAAGKSINVAKVLHALGAPCFATGFLGGDRGQSILRMLDSREIPHEFITVTTPTRECVTVIDLSADKVTELVEESQPVDDSEYERLLELVQRRMTKCNGMVLSGTIASGGPVDLYRRCAQLANAVEAPVFLDATGWPLLEALAARPALVKPNRAELEATLGRSLRQEGALKEAMVELHGRGAQRVVITAGTEPALAFDGERFWRVKAPEVDARNPIGSGDAFTAGTAWRLTLGEDFCEALRWGAAAGAANALTDMAGEVNLEDVNKLRPLATVEEA